MLRKLTPQTKKKTLRYLRGVVPEDDEWLHWWVYTFLGIWIPNVKVCAEHSPPFQAFADAFFGRYDVVVCHGSRLFGGKTFLSGLLATTRMILKSAECYILGGSKDQTAQMRDYIKSTSEHTHGIWWNYKRAPRALLKELTNDTVKLVNGGRITALAASQKETRSKHGTDLYIDEADEIEWDVFKSSLGQTYEGRRKINPLTFITSTWQYPEGTMSQIFEMAEDRDSWVVHEWCVAPETQVSTPTGRRRIDQIKAGDTVYGYDGSGVSMARVKWCGETRTSRTLDILLGNGRTLRCSPEHLLMTERGWTRAKYIQAGERIVSELRQPTAIRDDGAEEQDWALPGLLPATGSEQAPELLPGLRKADSAPIQEMPAVLHGQHDAAQQDERRLDGGGSRSEVLALSYVEGRAGRDAIAGSTGSAVYPSSPYGSIRDGYCGCGRRWDDCVGCKESISPQSAGGTRAQRAAQGRGGESWGGVSNPLGGREAPVVEGVAGFTDVVSITSGPEIQLWDMTVPGLHSFIAEGIVAHNCYRETHERYGGHNTQGEIDRKRGEMTEMDWHNEVELNRPESGDLIFAQETIDGLFVPTYGKFQDKVGHDYVFFEPTRRENFYTGTDWAKQRDFTVITTMIENPGGPDMVAAWSMRQKEPWPVMIEHHNRRVRTYGGDSMMDVTGLGSVIDDYVTVPTEGWHFSDRKGTHEMYSSLVVACESGEYALPEIPYLKKKFQTLTRSQLYAPKNGSQKNHPPDPFTSLALARKAKLEGTFELLLERA